MLIRKLLMAIFGFNTYLRIISTVFLRTYFSKIYLGAHRQVRFLSALVPSGATCIDIGANLGYFTLPLSHLAGKEGKVYAVEPVADFRKVLTANIQHFGKGNVEVMPYALGGEDHVTIAMGTPKVDGVVRHGRTEVLSGDATADNMAHTHEATMRTPSSLFGNLSRLDFIKCDVEGYELHIVPHLVTLIQKFQPIVEMEIDPLDHKRQLIELFRELGYRAYFLHNGVLRPLQIGRQAHQREIEIYFLAPKHHEQLGKYLQTDNV